MRLLRVRSLGAGLAAALLVACALPAALADFSGPRRAFPPQGSLELAVYSVMQPSDPLWIGWRHDRPGLAQLQAAWWAARVLPEPVPVDPLLSLEPMLTLGFRGGRIIRLLPSYEPVWVQGVGIGYTLSSSAVIASDANGHQELLSAPLLASALRGSWPIFHTGSRLQALVGPRDTVIIQGGGIVGIRAELSASPVYTGGIGGGMANPGSFPIGNAPVRGGEFTWRGRIRPPAHDTLYHPISGWQVTITALPFPGLRTNFGMVGIGLPQGAAPLVVPSPVRDAPTALSALREASYAESPFPR